MTFLIFTLIGLFLVRADIPACCDPKLLYGTWNFSVGPVVANTFDCSSLGIEEIVIAESYTIKLSIEEDGRHTVYESDTLVGRWTSMDSEGFDIFVNDLHYQAYFNFTRFDDEDGDWYYRTNCSQTLGGWVRKDVIKPDIFNCFYAEKIDEPTGDCGPIYAFTEQERLSGKHIKSRRYKKPYHAKPAKIGPSPSAKALSIPDSLDWTNYNGLNYVNRVYDQGDCGSCYAFGTLGALEARILIESNLTVDVSLSQQDIASCSYYSQGCNGGFTQEVGYWVKDHGIVDNNCFPYEQYIAWQEASCGLKCSEKDALTQANVNGLIYISNVSYIGGYHGACSEQLMLEALQKGPIPVGVCASNMAFALCDSSEIIDTTEDCPIDHSVLLVGYGEENGVKFWKIRNSWGITWGDYGFARILRGANTLQIESDAELIEPVPFSPPPTDDSLHLTKREKSLLVSTIGVSAGLLIAVFVAIVFAILFIIAKKKASYVKIQN